MALDKGETSNVKRQLDEEMMHFPTSPVRFGYGLVGKSRLDILMIYYPEKLWEKLRDVQGTHGIGTEICFCYFPCLSSIANLYKNVPIFNYDELLTRATTEVSVCRMD
jgi:hypothetical protein